MGPPYLKQNVVWLPNYFHYILLDENMLSFSDLGDPFLVDGGKNHISSWTRQFY